MKQLQLFGNSLQRLGKIGLSSVVSATFASALIEPPQSDQFLSKWESAFNQWRQENPKESDLNENKIDHPLQHSSNSYEYDLKLLADMADDFVIFHGTNCIELTEEIALILQKEVSSLQLGRYADGEVSVRLGMFHILYQPANECKDEYFAIF